MSDLQLPEAPREPNAPPGLQRLNGTPETQPAQNAPPGLQRLSGLNTRQYDTLATFLANSPDPRNEIARQEAVDYIAAATGRNRSDVYNDYDNIVQSMTGRDITPADTATAMREWWNNAWLAYEANNLKGTLFQQLSRGENPAATIAEIQRLEGQMNDTEALANNAFANHFLRPAIENLPMMIDPMLQGGITGMVVGGATAAAYALAPVTGGTSLVVPTLTAGLVGTAAGAAGTAVRSSEIMRNESIWELYQVEDHLGNRIDPQLATSIASVVGGLNGLIESVQLTQLIPGGEQIFAGAINRLTQKLYVNRFMKNRAVNAIARYGINVTDEALEEAQQEVVSVVANNLARELNNELAGTSFDPIAFEDAATRVLQAASEGWRASAVLAGPSNIVQTAQDFRQPRAEQGAAPTLETPAQQVPEEPTVQPDEPVDDQIPIRPVEEIQTEYQQIIQAFDQAPEDNARRLLDLSFEMERAESQRRAVETPAERPAYQMTRQEWLAQQEAQADIPAPRDFELSQPAREIRQRVLDATPNVSEVEADLVGELFDRRAEARGITPEQYRQEFDDRIAGDADALYPELRPGETMPQGNKGFIAYTQEAKAIIGLTQQSDFSTWVHELGHKFRTELDADLQQNAADYYGVQDGQWTRQAEERFTEDLTTWFMEGTAPNEQVRPMLERIGEFLKRIYRTLSGRAEVAPDIARVFEQIITPREQQTQQSAPADMELFQPRTIQYNRNPEQSENLGDRFQQDIEPAGRYVTESAGFTPEGWESGTIRFETPLVIPFSETGRYDETSWKARLSEQYNATGQELSQAIAADGYDGIITEDADGTTREIVDLRDFRQRDENAIQFQPASAQGTEAFERWFADSKVVDENGDPLVVYHGTGQTFEEFARSGETDDGHIGEGFYFTPQQNHAELYAGSNGPVQRVVPVYVSLQNPLIIRGFDDPAYQQYANPKWTGEQRRQAILADGYDGAILQQTPNLDDPYVDGDYRTMNEIVVFDPTHIKSAIANQGTYDPDNPNILMQPAEGDAHQQAVQQAVDNGEWVPDNVLSEYAGTEWADAELSRRIELREEAQQSIANEETADEFVEMQAAFDMDDHTAEYFRELYNSANNVLPPNPEVLADQWVESLSKPALSAYLHTIKLNFDADQLPHNVVASITKGLKGDNPQLTDAQYKKVMDQIRSRPLDWYETLSNLTEADDDIRMLQEAMKAHPEESRMRKLQKQVDELRANNKGLNADVEWLRQQIDRDIKYEGDLTRRIKELETERTDRETALQDAVQSARGEARITSRQNKEELRQALIDERRKVRKQIRDQQTVRDYVKRLIKDVMRRPSAAIDYGYAQRIIEIQERFDPRSFSRGKAGQIRKRLQEELPNISDEALRLILETELGKSSLRDMSLPELENLHKEIESLREAGRQELLEKVEARKAQDLRDVQAMVTELGGSAFLEDLGLESTNEQLKSSARTQFKFNVYNMKRITDELGNTWKQLFDTEINQRTDEKLRYKYAKVERYNELRERAGIRTRDLLENVTDTMTVNEALAIHIYMQNEDSAAAILNGNMITPQNLTAVRTFIDQNPNYAEFADGLMELFDDESFERLQQTFIDYSNTAMQRVQKYFPMRRQQIGDVPFETELQDDLLSRTHAGRTYAWRGFTHSRKHARGQGQAPLRLDAVNVALENIEKQEHFAALASHIKRLQRLMANRSIQEAFTGRYGREAYQVMQEYVNRVANPAVHRATTAAGKFFQDLRGNMTVGALAFNITSPIKNLVGPLLYLPHISNNPVEAVARMIAGMWSAATDKRVRDFIKESNPQVRERALDPALQEAAELSRRGGNKVRAVLQKIGMAPLQMIDTWTVIAGEHAVYSAEKARGKTHEEAVAAMQEATLRTQPFGDQKDTPAIYTDPTAKMFLMFSSPLNQIFGMMTKDFPQHLKDGRAGSASLALIGLVMTGVLLRSIGRKRAPESPEEWVKDIASQFIEMIPLLGPELMGVVDKSPFAGQGVSVTEAVVESARAVERIFDADTEPEVKWNSAVRAATEGMRIMGLPGVQAQRVYRMFVNDTGGFDPWEFVGGGPKE